MPSRPPAPCRHAGCPALVVGGGHCDTHRREDNRRRDRDRGNANARGYGHKWRKARASYLRAHPLCATCDRAGRVTAATVVDHIKPHRGDMALFWKRANWQPLCKPCHDEKTAREDGRWGG